MTSNVRNTADLRKMLLETIAGVRKGKVDHRQAQAISALSSRILQSARLDFDIMKLSQKAAPAQSTSLTDQRVHLVGGKKERLAVRRNA